MKCLGCGEEMFGSAIFYWRCNNTGCKAYDFKIYPQYLAKIENLRAELAAAHDRIEDLRVALNDKVRSEVVL